MKRTKVSNWFDDDPNAFARVAIDRSIFGEFRNVIFGNAANNATSHRASQKQIPKENMVGKWLKQFKGRFCEWDVAVKLNCDDAVAIKCVISEENKIVLCIPVRHYDSTEMRNT